MRALAALYFGALVGGVWWLDRERTRPATSATAGPPPFELRERARERGIDFVHQAVRVDPKLDNIAPHVTGMGAAVSVVDFDADGWPDLYATSSALGSANALYRNLGDGSFEDVAARAGLADLNRPGEGASMGSIWGDADNDGFEDVLVYRWGHQALLRNRGDGTFEDVSASSGVHRWMNANGAVWLDYDRDGNLDLYIAGYFPARFDLWNLETTRIMQDSFEFATNGGNNVLLRNLGGWRFEDVTERTGCDSTRWTLAVASADMDGDGWPDLYLANDYGPEELFLNRGGERFERAEKAGLAESSKSGMSVTLGDFENAGSFGVYVTNISRSGFLFQGNNLRSNRLAERGKLYNLSDAFGGPAREVVDCGWAWGAQFGDLDNDGRLDLYVVNGFISASRDQDYWYDMSKIAGGAGGIFSDATNWPTIGEKSLSGYERSKVLHNRGGARFADVSALVGASDDLDGRAVAFADLRNRGALDVIVANQKGRLLLYENEPASANGWIAYHLVGGASNRSAIGAELTLHYGELMQVQAVQGGSGFCSQNDRRLHFGLGAAMPRKGQIRWPSGLVQELGPAELVPGRLHRIEEPRP